MHRLKPHQQKEPFSVLSKFVQTANVLQKTTIAQCFFFTHFHLSTLSVCMMRKWMRPERKSSSEIKFPLPSMIIECCNIWSPVANGSERSEATAWGNGMESAFKPGCSSSSSRGVQLHPAVSVISGAKQKPLVKPALLFYFLPSSYLQSLANCKNY